MRVFVLCICLLWAGSVSAQNRPVLEAFIDGQIEARDIRISAAQWTEPPVLWTDEISVQGAAYIRVLLRVEGPAFPSGARVKFVGTLGQEFSVQLDTVGVGGYWSNLLPLGRARFALVSELPVDASSVLVIDSVAIQSTKLVPFSTHGENQLTMLNASTVPEHLRQLGKPVAFLSFIRDGFARTCTGFLISPNQLVTNEHCINSEATCRSMTASFGFEVDENGRLDFGPQLRCAGYESNKTNFDLDITVVTLDGVPGDGFGHVDIFNPGSVEMRPLVIVQHPGSEPKQISIIDCVAAEIYVEGRAAGSDFSHTCDTAGGSSGSPVFDLEGRLVGLHHFGFQDGQKWNENRGVHIELISNWLRSVLSDSNNSTGDVPAIE